MGAKTNNSSASSFLYSQIYLSALILLILFDSRFSAHALISLHALPWPSRHSADEFCFCKLQAAPHPIGNQCLKSFPDTITSSITPCRVCSLWWLVQPTDWQSACAACNNRLFVFHNLNCKDTHRFCKDATAWWVPGVVTSTWTNQQPFNTSDAFYMGFRLHSSALRSAQW